VDDKGKLLDELVIDRSGRSAAPATSRPWLVGIAAVAVVLLALAVWLLVSRRSVVPAADAAAPLSAGTDAAAVPTSNSQLDASGYVVARREATVSATINGRVTEVLISEGTRVKQGQVLARLDDGPYRLMLAQAKAQAEAIQAQLHATETALANAQPIYQRMKKQFAAGYLSGQDYDAAKSSFDSVNSTLEVQRQAAAVARAQVAIAERNLTDTVVRAPFSGVVTQKNAQPGEIVSPGAAGGSIRTGIGTIVDMDSLEVEIDVSENFINRVRPDQKVTITLNAYPDWNIPGHVIAVIPTADRAKATVKVRVGFDQRDERVLPDMGARVSFLRTEGVAAKS
jgi:HlyD family secretion protein